MPVYFTDMNVVMAHYLKNFFIIIFFQSFSCVVLNAKVNSSPAIFQLQQKNRQGIKERLKIALPNRLKIVLNLKKVFLSNLKYISLRYQDLNHNYLTIALLSYSVVLLCCIPLFLKNYRVPDHVNFIDFIHNEKKNDINIDEVLLALDNSQQWQEIKALECYPSVISNGISKKQIEDSWQSNMSAIITKYFNSSNYCLSEETDAKNLQSLKEALEIFLQNAQNHLMLLYYFRFFYKPEKINRQIHEDQENVTAETADWESYWSGFNDLDDPEQEEQIRQLKNINVYNLEDLEDLKLHGEKISNNHYDYQEILKSLKKKLIEKIININDIEWQNFQNACHTLILNKFILKKINDFYILNYLKYAKKSIIATVDMWFPMPRLYFNQDLFDGMYHQLLSNAEGIIAVSDLQGSLFPILSKNVTTAVALLIDKQKDFVYQRDDIIKKFSLAIQKENFLNNICEISKSLLFLNDQILLIEDDRCEAAEILTDQQTILIETVVSSIEQGIYDRCSEPVILKKIDHLQFSECNLYDDPIARAKPSQIASEIDCKCSDVLKAEIECKLIQAARQWNHRLHSIRFDSERNNRSEKSDLIKGIELFLPQIIELLLNNMRMRVLEARYEDLISTPFFLNDLHFIDRKICAVNDQLTELHNITIYSYDFFEIEQCMIKAERELLKKLQITIVHGVITSLNPDFYHCNQKDNCQTITALWDVWWSSCQFTTLLHILNSIKFSINISKKPSFLTVMHIETKYEDLLRSLEADDSTLVGETSLSKEKLIELFKVYKDKHLNVLKDDEDYANKLKNFI